MSLSSSKPHYDPPKPVESSPDEEEGATLECGTSRAENEHYTDDDDNGRVGVEDHAGIQPQNSHSLTALREQLAASVVTDPNGGCGRTMIASPLYVHHSTTTTTVVPLVYCDQTASNRPVRTIERYMEQVCLPLYGNTHTNTSITGSQT